VTTSAALTAAVAASALLGLGNSWSQTEREDRKTGAEQLEGVHAESSICGCWHL
jgi:hypothetical protein